MALSEARKRANKKYASKHRKQANRYSIRSSAKRYVKTASVEELDDIQKLVDIRRQELKEGGQDD